jgi:hypothetical protein
MSSDFIPPTVSQIRQVNVQLRANQLLPAFQLMELCKGTGVHEGTLKKVGHLLPEFACDIRRQLSNTVRASVTTLISVTDRAPQKTAVYTQAQLQQI